MDIQKLQSAIVDGLEDVKAQGIQVFDTEHLSPLFERVIIASGTSNRQTKALAASVRDAVKASGFPVLRTEGESNGEWIIVDCGAAVVHVMQPSIREYYHLEEIWGEKPVKLKAAKVTKLVKAEEPAPAAKKAPAKKVAAKKSPVAAKPVASKTPAKKAAAKTPVKVAAKKAPAKKAASVVTRTVGLKSPASKRAAAARNPAAKKAPARPAAKKAAARPAAKKATRKA